MRRLLVIGADGLIGRAVVQAALADGVNVVAADRHTRGAVDWPTRVVDVTDELEVMALLRDTKPDAVVLLAAHGIGDQGLAAGAATDPGRAADINVRGAALVTAACGEAACGTVVLASSTTVYGPASSYSATRVTEDVPLRASSVYGATKVGAEAVVFAVGRRYGLHASAIRLPLVYGPGRWYGGTQEELVNFAHAVAHENPTRVSAWTRQADWIYADDAARSICAAAAANIEGPLNVAGHTSSLYELAGCIATHATAPAEIEPADTAGPDLPLIDVSRARGTLGFTARYDTAAAGAHAYITHLRSTS